MKFSEAFHLNIRAIRLLQKYQPALLSWMAAAKITEAVYPYVGVYCSARIIGVLAGSREPKDLLFWVLVTLAATAILGAVRHWAAQRYTGERRLVWETTERILAEKRMDMDYPDAVSQQAQGLYDRIIQLQNYIARGLACLCNDYLPKLILSVFSILSALALTAGLFTAKVSEPSWAVLNSPILAAGMLAVMAALAWLVGKIDQLSEQRMMLISDKGRFGNRLFSFFGFRVYEEKDRQMDMRLYDQDPLCLHYYTTDTTFSAKGELAKEAKRYLGFMQAGSEAAAASFLLPAYLYVCLKAWAGAFGIDGVSQYVGAITAMSEGVCTLFGAIATFQVNGEALQTVFSYLDTPNAMYQGSLTTEKRSDRRYEVEFRDVSFRYPGSENWALRHVNLKFQIGKRLAVVGENGSGKTTFIKLLCRLYDPTEGHILLNGIDIHKYRYDEYMDIFSIVFQDFVLPAYTLADAVTAGKPLDRGRVERCLQQAGFGERLKTMPQGLNTMLYRDLSKKGVEISGGEAQKIAIARTLYKDSPFIILDEPTAALDPKAEAEIYEKFNEIIGDKTAVYISHRLSSCKFCDEIAVFSHGSIVQKGTHQALLEEKNGIYAALWHAQAQYYTEK